VSEESSERIARNERATQTSLFDGENPDGLGPEPVSFNEEKLARFLEQMRGQEDPVSLRRMAVSLKRVASSPKTDRQGLLNAGEKGGVSFRRDVLISELNQVLEARTLERARYYVRRLEKALQGASTSQINDINLLRWKEYDEIITDSLWVLDRRDSSGAHLASYWGNFIPQIPHQMMLRYTKKGEWVLDAFAGSGTTLIECRKLGRNGIGIELNPDVARGAEEVIAREPNRDSTVTAVIIGDSRTLDLGLALERHGIESVQLVFMHPPRHHQVLERREGPLQCGGHRGLPEDVW
jgi:hypothetical protein